MAQRARRDRERLEQPPRLPRFFPSLTLSRRQRAQIERAKAKRPLTKLDVIYEELPKIPAGSSGSTTSQSDSPSNFVFEEEANLEVGVECSVPIDGPGPSSRTNMQSHPQTRCEL